MSITTHIFEGMQYAVRYPESYTEGEKYPVIMFLPGGQANRARELFNYRLTGYSGPAPGGSW